MPQPRIDSVRKKDGRVETYDEAKLSESIRRAALAAGCEPSTVARDLAGVVTTYLARYHERPPESGEIRSMVEKVLLETGHAEIARAFMTQDEPAPAAPELFPSDLFLVEGATRDEVSGWARDRITTALVKEAGLPEEAAREIAAAVEQRIFSRRERRVSTTHIRELVNQELLTRGYGAPFRKQVVVGLPKYDLERLVRPDAAPTDPDALCRTIGETTMKQYALQELYPASVSEAHLQGRIHIHDLEYPQKQFRTTVTAAPGAPTARALTSELASAVRALRHTFARIEIPGFGAHYATRGGHLEEAPYALDRLDAERIGFEAGDESSDRFLIEILKTWRGGATRVAFTVTDRSLRSESTLLACVRFALRHGPSLFILQRGPAAFEGASVAGAVSLNLPQAFYRSEAGSDFHAELDRAVDAAVGAHARKRTLLTPHPAPDSRLYAVGVTGLDETCRLLTGRGPAEDEGSLRVALRTLAYLDFRLREESARTGLRLALHDAGGEAGARLLRIDSQMFARARWIEAIAGTEYSSGIRLRCPAEMAPLETIRLHARLQVLVADAGAPIGSPLPAEAVCSAIQQAFLRTSATRLWIA